MLTEDLQPWLIEVNSSPSMARTTRVTADLVDCVLEDTVKGKRALFSLWGLGVEPTVGYRGRPSAQVVRGEAT